MEEKLWIRVENGQVLAGHHPAYESNILEAFPELNGDPSSHFAPFVLTAYPVCGYDEVVEGPTYTWAGDSVTNVYTVRPMTADEIQLRDQRQAENTITEEIP